jgi:gamma-glutamyltranspeptidase/glutathione hydrolase
MARANASSARKAALGAILCSALAGAFDGPAAVTAATHPPLATSRGVVASDHPVASQVGAAVLTAGGNAIDAAAATAFALGVLRPMASGLGGGGFALVYVAATGEVHAVDFREVGPAAITPAHFVRDGAVVGELAQHGGLAVAVPGEVAGLAHLIERFGRRSFAHAVAPAERLARAGFAVDWFLAKLAAEYADEHVGDAPFQAWLAPGGRPLASGAHVTRPHLARTLARLRRSGARAFYHGAIARDIVAAVTTAGGIMTVADLASYRVVERTPLVGTWRGHRVVTMPLPSSGGIVVLEVLGILDAGGVDLAAHGAGSSAALHWIAEALKHGFADRARFLGDVNTISPAAMLDGARLARLARRIAGHSIAATDDYGDPSLGGDPAPPTVDGGTSHICVVDAAGNAVALTTTVNGDFGAHLVAPRTGIVLNNEMDDFSLGAEVPNLFELVQGEANRVGPGKRPLSSMSPTLVLAENRGVVACLGGSGGPRIISNVVQVLLHLFVFDMDVRRAVESPRIHHQWRPEILRVEREIAADVVEQLRARGHSVETWQKSSAIQAIFVRQDGVREAASDPRKGGAPAAEGAPVQRRRRPRPVASPATIRSQIEPFYSIIRHIAGGIVHTGNNLRNYK